MPYIYVRTCTPECLNLVFSPMQRSTWFVRRGAVPEIIIGYRAIYTI